MPTNVIHNKNAQLLEYTSNLCQKFANGPVCDHSPHMHNKQSKSPAISRSRTPTIQAHKGKYCARAQLQSSNSDYTLTSEDFSLSYYMNHEDLNKKLPECGDKCVTNDAMRQVGESGPTKYQNTQNTIYKKEGRFHIMVGTTSFAQKWLFHFKNPKSFFRFLLAFFWTDTENLRLLISFIIISLTVYYIGPDHLTLTFIICMLCLANISVAISTKVFNHMQANQNCFREDLRQELPAILTYYQSIHQAKKGQDSLCIPIRISNYTDTTNKKGNQRKNKKKTALLRYSWS